MSSSEVTEQDRHEDMLGFTVGLVGVTALVLTVLARTVPNVAGVLAVAALWLIGFALVVRIPVALLIRSDR